MTLFQKLRHFLARIDAPVPYLSILILLGLFLLTQLRGNGLLYLALLLVWGLLPFARRRISILSLTCILCSAIQFFLFGHSFSRAPAGLAEKLSADFLTGLSPHALVTLNGILIIMACAVGVYIILFFAIGKSDYKFQIHSYLEVLAYGPIRRTFMAISWVIIGVTLLLSLYCVKEFLRIQ